MTCPLSKSGKTQLLQIRSLLNAKAKEAKEKQIPAESHDRPKTGLNYVELVYEKYMTEQKQRAGLLNLLDEVST